jgi:hypothetical protein
MNEYTLDDARAFISTARFRFASTMKWAPHFYVRCADCDASAWRAFARYVYAHAVPWHWKGPKSFVYQYCDIDGFMYWCAEDEAILVNRAKIHEPDQRTPVFLKGDIL